MRSPFPGMDPYIEYQASWLDFQNRLVTSMCESLGVTLPEDYVARTDERIEIVSFAEKSGHFGPDVLISRERGPRPPVEPPSSSGNAATIAPVMAEVRLFDEVEERVVWLEIFHLPEMELVTVVEVLSPSNKQSPGRASDLRKRRELLNRSVNLVEIDLLLGGHRPPMEPSLDAWDYVAAVARPESLPQAEVYGWSIRDPLPSLPIPLKPPDPDAILNLAPLATHIYDSGRYRKTLRYDQPLPEIAPLRDEDREWASSRGDAT